MNGKEKLLKAAAHLFEKNGYNETSMDEIVDQATVSKGLAYYYFKNKEDLLRAILISRLEEFDELTTLLKSKASARSRLNSLCEYVFQDLSLNENKQRFLLTTFLLPNNQRVVSSAIKELRHCLSELHNEQIRLLRDLGCPHPQKELILFRASLHGITHLYLMNPDTFSIRQALQIFKDRYLKESRDMP